MRISDWSSDVCSSDLIAGGGQHQIETMIASVTKRAGKPAKRPHARTGPVRDSAKATPASPADHQSIGLGGKPMRHMEQHRLAVDQRFGLVGPETARSATGKNCAQHLHGRGSEEHTSELQSLMRHSYAV